VRSPLVAHGCTRGLSSKVERPPEEREGLVRFQESTVGKEEGRRMKDERLYR
jgi:hypothetical protein